MLQYGDASYFTGSAVVNINAVTYSHVEVINSTGVIILAGEFNKDPMVRLRQWVSAR